MDVEAVRRALGYDAIDLYAFSYGTVPEQAYLVRYPEHVHAAVFDAGMSVTDPAHVWGWDLGVPGALAREMALMCTRDPSCHVADPALTVRWLVHRAGVAPIRGRVDPADGPPANVTVDQEEVANLFQSTGTCSECGQIDPGTLVTAAERARKGDPEPLLRLAGAHPVSTESPSDPSEFSAGANLAAFCNDQDFVWNRTDPIDVRVRKYRAAVAALPRSAFAPFSARELADLPAGGLPDVAGSRPVRARRTG